MTLRSVLSFQLLSDLLAPVSDQVSEHISDFSIMPCIRAHIKNSINSSSQVGAAPTPELTGLENVRTLPSSLVFQFCLLRPLFPTCFPRRSALLPALCQGRTGDVRRKVKGSLRPGGWPTVSSSNGKGGAPWKMWTREGWRGTTRDPSLVRPLVP